MAFLGFRKASRKLQRTLRNLRVSFLCFLLTFLVLRNTIGAGKFGTPAQDFEEIRLHLHNVGLPRRHFRVLAEALEEEKPPPLQASDGGRKLSLPIDLERNKVTSLWEKEKQKSATLAGLKAMHLSEESLAFDVRRRNVPLRASRKDTPDSLLKVTKMFEGLRLPNKEEPRNRGQAPAHGRSKVVVVEGLQSSSCKKSSGDHLLLNKLLKNKVQYSKLHGFEVSESSDLHVSSLSLLQSSMEKHPHAEWLWWVTNAALIITDAAFELPLLNYTERNIVLFGAVGATYHINSLIINLTSDSFLIRNCQWSLELVRTSAKMSLTEDKIGADMLVINPMGSKSDLEAAGASAQYTILPSQEGRSFRERIYVEDSIVLRGNLNDLAFKLKKILARNPHAGLGQNRLPFITHFLGCELCHKVGNEEDGKCAKQMERVFLFAEEQTVLQRMKGLNFGEHSLM